MPGAETWDLPTLRVEFLGCSTVLCLGDKDQAMTWLEKAFEDRSNPGVLLRTSFDSFRSDSRFKDLVRRVGLSL